MPCLEHACDPTSVMMDAMFGGRTFFQQISSANKTRAVFHCEGAVPCHKTEMLASVDSLRTQELQTLIKVLENDTRGRK